MQGPSIKADQMTQANQLAPIAETDCNDKEDKLTSFGSSLALRWILVVTAACKNAKSTNHATLVHAHVYACYLPPLLLIH